MYCNSTLCFNIEWTVKTCIQFPAYTRVWTLKALLAFCIINQLVLIGSLFTNRPTQKAMAGYNFMEIIKTWVLDYRTPISFSLVATFWGNDSLIITVINWVCGQHLWFVGPEDRNVAQGWMQHFCLKVLLGFLVRTI